MFELDKRSRKSIYEQVVDNFKELILIGVIAPDEKLPSVREMSKRLTVNPNTIQKAIRELERQGYVYTVTGVGTFAAAPEDIEKDQKLIQEGRKKLSDDLMELDYYGLTETEIREMVEEILVLNKKRMSRNKK